MKSQMNSLSLPVNFELAASIKSNETRRIFQLTKALRNSAKYLFTSEASLQFPAHQIHQTRYKRAICPISRSARAHVPTAIKSTSVRLRVFRWIHHYNRSLLCALCAPYIRLNIRENHHCDTRHQVHLRREAASARACVSICDGSIEDLRLIIYLSARS